ncbi:histidine kinase [Streptomyces sp. Z26]|uniref:sensor histidine kinase n=1 Tax=Streptomyces sp. Z26 TaxID=2500177 RepID=UPI0019D25D94|nr:histidine kinase [Streptomyces sp. Z26]
MTTGRAPARRTRVHRALRRVAGREAFAPRRGAAHTPRETPERDSSAQRRLSRLNLTMLLPLLATVGAVQIAVDADGRLDAVVLGVGVLAGMVAFVRWAAGDVLGVAVPCLAVSTAVWFYGSVLSDCHSAFYGLLITGVHVVPRLPRRREAGAVALALVVAVIGAGHLLTSGDAAAADLVGYVVVPTGVTVVVTGVMFPNQKFYDVVRELEESREREAELAVVRERMRFASDLHDIQGHTLHVVKLKTALARKLVRADADRAEQELREIHDLVADTIRQTKELAYAQRRLNLSAELENAKNLFEAAGIRVHVDREAEVDPRAGELLGQVLRETTTNILRHARATEVRITLAAAGITIVNDGASGDAPPRFRGLATLRDRLADDGGGLTAERTDGRFLTAASFPRLGGGDTL